VPITIPSRDGDSLDVVSRPTAGTVATLVGVGPERYQGEQIPVKAAGIGGPSSVVSDSQGRIYIATPDSRRVRILSADGRISTIAGTGQYGCPVTGQLAISSRLGYPSRLAFDNAGRLLILDEGCNSLWRVESNGTLQAVINSANQRGIAGDGQSALNAQLQSPSGIALAADGRIFIAEQWGHRIRVVSANGTISTLAGSGQEGSADGIGTAAQFRRPAGLALNAGENELFVADQGNHRIRRINLSNGSVTTLAGDGQCGFIGENSSDLLNSRFCNPIALAVRAGSLYVSDHSTHRIRKIDLTSNILSTVVGTGNWRGDRIEGASPLASMLDSPDGLSFDASGDLLIAERGSNQGYRVRKWALSSNQVFTVAGRGGLYEFASEALSASAASVWGVYGVAVSPAGDVVYTEGAPTRVRKVDMTNGLLGQLSAGMSGCLTSVAYGKTGDMYVTDPCSAVVWRIAAGGVQAAVFAGTQNQWGYSGDGGLATSAKLNNPNAVAVDASGNVFIADTNNARVRRVDVSTGIISTVLGNGDCNLNTSLCYPNGLVFNSTGDLFISEQGAGRISKVNLATPSVIERYAGGGGDGNDDVPATSAFIGGVRHLSFDARGDLFLVEVGSDRVRKIDSTTKKISTVAGSGIRGFADSINPSQAMFDDPNSLAVDPTGNLIVADSSNNRIRMVFCAANPTSGKTSLCDRAGTSLDIGYPFLVRWAIADATSCVAGGAWSGVKAARGLEIYFPRSGGEKQFILRCETPSGVVEKILMTQINGVPEGRSLSAFSGGEVLGRSFSESPTLATGIAPTAVNGYATSLNGMLGATAVMTAPQAVAAIGDTGSSATNVESVDPSSASIYQLVNAIGSTGGLRNWEIRYLDSGRQLIGAKALPATRDVLWFGINARAVELPSQGYLRLCGEGVWVARDGYSMSITRSDKLLSSVTSRDITVGSDGRSKLISSVSCLAGGGVSISGFLLPVDGAHPLLNGSMQAEEFTIALDQAGSAIRQSRRETEFDVDRFCEGRASIESAEFCRARQ
jgi:sugar lactone lactonase YvrE